MVGHVSCVGPSGLFCRGRCKWAGDIMEEDEPVGGDDGWLVSCVYM